MFIKSAELLRDRVTPLDQLLPRDWCDDLMGRVVRSNRRSDIKIVLDDFFQERLPPPHPHEAVLAKIAEAQVRIDNRLLLRLTKRYFGFPPKLLLMRTRFLCAMTAMLVGRAGPDFGAVPSGYHDQSHFIRDGNRFLGTTPRRFLALELPYTRAVLRTRLLVMGAAISALDPVHFAVTD